MHLQAHIALPLMLGAAFAASPAGAFQGNQEAQEQAPPRFKAEVSAVLVDVLVLDEQGRPVSGLTREDFQIFEDGVQEEVANFEVIDWTSYVARDAPQDPTSLPPGATVNAFPRRFVFIINRQNARTRFIRQAKMALESFVVESMADGDEALVLDMGNSTKVLQQFKDSKGETIQTIRKISLMEADLYRGTGSDIGTRNVYDTLESLGQGLGQFPGRKIVIFLSPELGQTQNLITYLEDTVDAFNQSNTSVYSIDIRGTGGVRADVAAATISSADAFGIGGLFPLANETGGRYYYNINTFEPVLRRIGVENSRYYLLTYTPSNTDYDGKYRSIEVRVNRPDVNVVARRGYIARKDRAPLVADAAPEESEPPAAAPAPEEADPPAAASAAPKKEEASPAAASAPPAKTEANNISRTPSGPPPPAQVEITTYLFAAASAGNDEVEVPIAVALPLDMFSSDEKAGGRTLKLTITNNDETVVEFSDAVDERNFFVVRSPRLAPGLYLLQMTVEASGEQIYQASTGLEVPEGFGKRFGFSSIVPVFPPRVGASGQVESIEIRPTPSLRKGEDAYLYFRVFHGEGAQPAEDDAELAYVIYRDDREVRSGRHGNPLRLSGSGDAGFPVLLRLPTRELSRGSYRVVLRVSSSGLGRRAATEIELAID